MIAAPHPFQRTGLRVRDEYGRELCTCGRPRGAHRNELAGQMPQVTPRAADWPAFSADLRKRNANIANVQVTGWAGDWPAPDTRRH